MIFTPPAFAQPARFRVAFPKLKFERPVFLTYLPDGSDRILVTEQAGKVYIFENDREVAKPRLALDLSNKVSRQGEEEGLLGLAFHPDFKNNRQVFLHYSASNPRRGVIARFTMNEDATAIKPDSEQVILEIMDPWSNHNGGMLAFGQDGYLYIAMGDGGGGGDPLDSGQTLGTLLGKILRIDVDRRTDELAYAIPDDNPFADQPEARGELWAFGLRNVWRFSFDRETGALWAGDVGQDAWEEINLIVRGGNYGWRLREGKHDFNTEGKTGKESLIEPVVEHDHNEAKSITGGYVYRGKAIPALQGAYIYGDYVTGHVWYLRYDGKQVTEHKLFDNVPGIASFGEDRDGEIYICSFDGRIHKLMPRH